MFIHNLRTLKDSNRTAVHDGTNAMSYRTFWERSEAIALYLLDKYGTSKEPVAIYGDKENDMLPSIFGILKSGRAYVVLPSYYPTHRISSILEDCKAKVILNPHSERFPSDGYDIKMSADIDELVNTWHGQEADESNYVKGNDDACLVYTSGSTGTPKGVRISYNNIKSRIGQMHKVIAPALPDKDIRTVMFSSYAFSASFYNVYYMFATVHVTLYGFSKRIVHDHATLMEHLRNIQPHTMAGTPSMIRRLLTSPEFSSDAFPSLALISMGGEPMSKELAATVKERFPRLRLLNIYGMSELASGPMVCVITDEMLKSDQTVMPIGQPMEGVQISLVDKNGSEITDENATGELVVTGDCVSNGYLNREELTASVFFETEDEKRGYRAGDIVRRENGLYYFVGRKDNRIKIGGNRIELEDIEANMKQLDIVADCAVTVKEQPTASLVAFVVKADEMVSNIAAVLAIKNGLKERVESHMIPQKIVFVEELPKNINFKVDRVALRKRANEE